MAPENPAPFADLPANRAARPCQAELPVPGPMIARSGWRRPPVDCPWTEGYDLPEALRPGTATPFSRRLPWPQRASGPPPTVTHAVHGDIRACNPTPCHHLQAAPGLLCALPPPALHSNSAPGFWPRGREQPLARRHHHPYPPRPLLLPRALAPRPCRAN